LILRIFDFQSGAFKDAESNPVEVTKKRKLSGTLGFLFGVESSET